MQIMPACPLPQPAVEVITDPRRREVLEDARALRATSARSCQAAAQAIRRLQEVLSRIQPAGGAVGGTEPVSPWLQAPSTFPTCPPASPAAEPR
jgi:hypothetical protein